jgi:hypothetical protein
MTILRALDISWQEQIVFQFLSSGRIAAHPEITLKMEFCPDLRPERTGRRRDRCSRGWRKILATVAHKHGYEKIGMARLINDALIATSADRNGISVFTTNPRGLGTVLKQLVS